MYSAIVLDEKSQLALSAWADNNVKVNYIRLPVLVRDGWKMFCHHMTIQYPGTPEFVKPYIDTEQKLEATHVGISDKAVAVRVVGFYSANKIPHVTVAVDVKRGGKPVDSNKITTWLPMKKTLKLRGIVKELN